MAQETVVAIADVLAIRGDQRDNGCSKNVLSAGDHAEASVFHVKPGGGVRVHLHSRVHDLFIGMQGDIEIAYEGQQGEGIVQLKAGGFCSMPPGVRHEVRNVGAAQEAIFMLIHAPYQGYDFVKAPFKRQVSAFDAA
jgi:mannose-6-phosphate isomerase-like protein (cupin superfamily)